MGVRGSATKKVRATMRYENEDKSATGNKKEYNKKRNQKERQRKLAEKNRTPTTDKWKHLNAKVMRRPVNLCTIQRMSFVQAEVSVECAIFGTGSASIYKVRFIHKRTLEFARALMPGDFISLDECRFSNVAGRGETEVLVKRARKLSA